MKKYFFTIYIFLCAGLILTITTYNLSIPNSTTKSVEILRTPVYHPESSWLFLEHFLIHQSKNNVDSLLGKRSLIAVTAAGTGILSFLLAKKLLETKNQLVIPTSIGAGAAVSFIHYYTLRTYFLDQEECNQLTMLIKLWPQLRDKIPYEVWPLLDTLYATWLRDPVLFQQQIKKTLTLLKIELYSHLPNKHREYQSSFFTSNNLQLRLSLDLYKASKKLYTMIKKLW